MNRPNLRFPRNTTRAMQEDTPVEAMLFLARSMSDGPAGAIEAQEAAGQREVVNSTVIPTEVLHSTEKDLKKLGFTLGPVVDGDPLFREATLPAGWKREGSDHNMWSYIVDVLGRRRCSIFYKAAFYDRSAHISVVSVGGYVSECFYNDETPLLDDTWATRKAVLRSVDERLKEAREKVEFWDGRDEPSYLQEAREKVAKYEAFRSQIESGDRS